MYEQHIECLNEMLWSTAPTPTPRQSTALCASMALMRKSAAAVREELEREVDKARTQGRTEGYAAAADEVRDCNAHAEAYKADCARLEAELEELRELAARALRFVGMVGVGMLETRAALTTWLEAHPGPREPVLGGIEAQP